jgi:hypothetical protein
MVMVPARPFFIGRPSWVRSNAWIWLFSSTDNHGVGGRIDIEADDVAHLGRKLRIVRELELADTCIACGAMELTSSGQPRRLRLEEQRLRFPRERARCPCRDDGVGEIDPGFARLH